MILSVELLNKNVIMRIINYSLLLIPLLVLGACQKEPLTKPVDFTETSYLTLGSYDSSGKPNYLLPKDPISSGMLSFVRNTLIEATDLRNTSPELLTNNTYADIVITQSSDVFITFVSQNTSPSNALAFYTYSTGNPPSRAKDIKTITYIFPSAGRGTPLRSGDKVKIGRFEPGTTIGFVILRGAWNNTTKTIDNNVEHFCSTDSLNPEVDPKLKKHAVSISYTSENKTLIGFENTDRTKAECDHDFNDLVFYATVTP